MSSDQPPNMIGPGAVVSHYQILGRLGAGGMGEVYKALDTVLGRPVALKVLPPHVLRNEERTRRFVQEARSASSLNHPNIITIYEIGQAPLVAGDSTAASDTNPVDPIHFIAMELVEGVTLKHKIHDEGASLRTLLTYVAQAAEGLAKAHAAGIVHRDLKPENIMVSADGFAKVLDFGLAKLTRQGAGDAHTHTDTRTAVDDTRDGVILGTVAYMSPEQVQGKTADHRSDIFALGTILYEAATRRRPFAGDSDVDVMHKILHDKPQPAGEINPVIPAELRRTIRRCLAKEPERRFQSMKDVAIELAEIVDEFEQLSLVGGSSTSGSGASALPPLSLPETPWWKRPVVPMLLLGLGALVFGAYQWQVARDTGGTLSFASMNIRPLTSSGRAYRRPAISPDGKYIAYVTRGSEYSLWMRQVATGTEVQVVPAQAMQLHAPAFSPDGNYLYYLSSEEGSANVVYSGLYAVPSIGGQPRKLLFDVDTAVAFSPDGKQIAFGRGVPGERQNQVVVANADGSGARVLASFLRMVDAIKPAWSPDGTTIVTAVVDPIPAWDVAPVAIDVATGATRRLGSIRRFSVTGIEFLPDGSGLLMAAADAESAREQLWLQPYPDGVPQRVTNDLSDYRGLALSRDGSIITALKSDTKTWLAVSDIEDTTLGTPIAPAATGRLQEVAVAASGAIAYGFATDNTPDIAVLDTPQSSPRVVTHEDFNFGATISGDSRMVVFSKETGEAPPHVFAVAADGSNLRQITNGPGEFDPHLSADGTTLVFSSAHGNEVWVQRLTGGERTRLTDRASGRARVSPDGRYVLFLEWQSAELAAANLKVVPVTGGAAVLEMPWSRGVNFRWHPDGKTITFQRLDRGVNNVFSVPLTGGEPAPLTKFQRGTFSSFDWTGDGRLVLLRTETTSDIVLITEWREP